MSEKFTVLAENVSALTPLDEATHNILDQYGVDEHRRQKYVEKFSAFTTEQLDRIELAIALSRPQRLEPVTGMHEPNIKINKSTGLDLHELGVYDISIDPKTFHREVKAYEAIKHSPKRKLEKDSELVLSFLGGFGTSNSLRTAEGFDAIFELGKMRRLLERDYKDVVKQAGSDETFMPELRFVEALVIEQMALLWAPTALKSASALPEEIRDLIANPNDLNAFNENQISQLTDKQKWVLIGAMQCYEAAKLFEKIYKSNTASELVEQQAVTRWTDMAIRGKLLERVIADPLKRLELQESVRNIAHSQEKIAYEFRKHDLKRRQAKKHNFEKNGKKYIPTEEEKKISAAAFEAVVVAHERKKVLDYGLYDRLVRLAMPGEDQIEKTIKPLIVGGSLKINLSSDVIIERLNGKRLVAFQVKNEPELIYYELEKQKTKDTGLITVYPAELIAMRFTDSPGYEDKEDN